MLPATHKQVLKTIHWYIKRKIPFTYEVQNETINVISKFGSYSTRSKEYTINEINFIKEVKRHIIKNGLQNPYRDRFTTPESRKNIKYFFYNKTLKPGQELNDLLNIDLTAAYWQTAKKFGLFDGAPHLYEQGLSWEKAIKRLHGSKELREERLLEMIRTGKSNAIRKQVRLTAIGSLAKKKRIYKFDGKKQVELPTKRSEKTEFLWDVICEHVGNLLCQVAKSCGKDFVFFWVDGIYIKPQSRNKVEQLFKKAGYSWKIEPITWIKTTDRNIILKCPGKLRQKIINGETVYSDEFSFPFRYGKIGDQLAGYNTDL